MAQMIMVVNREWNTLSLFGCFMHEWSWMPRATCSHLVNDLMFEYPYNAPFYGIDGYGYVQRKNTLFYWDVLCMNGYGCLEQTCSHLQNNLMFEYPYNAQILWHGWIWLSIEKELSFI